MNERQIIILQLSHKWNWNTVLLLIQNRAILMILQRDMTEPSVENVNTEKMRFEDLNIPGDYSDYDVLKE